LEPTQYEQVVSPIFYETSLASSLHEYAAFLALIIAFCRTLFYTIADLYATGWVSFLTYSLVTGTEDYSIANTLKTITIINSSFFTLALGFRTPVPDSQLQLGIGKH